MKNQSIRDKYSALSMLASRTLPSPTAINKVTYLLTKFQKAFDATETARKKVIANCPLPEGHEGDRLPVAIAEARQAAMDRQMELHTPVGKVADTMRLTADDMPKVLKGDEGWRNAEALPAIKRMLGGLYVRRGDEIVPEVEGEEIDDAPTTAADPMAEHQVES